MKGNNIDIDALHPRNCLSGKVMRINRITANIFRKYLQPFGITDSQLSLLFMLNGLGSITQKELADFAKLEKSSLNRNLKRLVEREYVSRTDFPMLQLTQSGKKLVEEVRPEWENAMQEIRGILGAEGEEAINLVLRRLADL